MEESDWPEEATLARAMPFRRSRSSRRDRNRKAEDDAQQRLSVVRLGDSVLKPDLEETRETQVAEGDAHWSKLLQVNSSEDDMRLVRRLSSNRAKKEKEKGSQQNSREPSGERPGGEEAGAGGEMGNTDSVDRGGNHCQGGFINGSSATEGTCARVISSKSRHGILAAVTSRIRQWLGSRRKSEISPREPFVNSCVSSDGGQQQIKSGKDPSTKENVLGVDAVLNRCGAGRLSPCLPQRLPNGYAAATAAETGKIPLQRSPVFRHDQNRIKLPTTPSKAGSVLTMLSQAITSSALNATTKTTPSGASGTMSKSKSKNLVDIKIEVVDVSGLMPSALSPSASRLLASSRRHLLRQSRNKLKDRGVLVTSLVPSASNLTHQPLTTTISCPPQADSIAGLCADVLRRCHSWPMPRRKALPEDDECPDSAKEEALQSAGLNGQESLEDCSIRFEDLELGDCIKVGRRCKIYRARWHGDVFVHLFGELVKRPDREGFWRDVAKLCRIRHENINLFMGACTMAPNLAVITSSVTGKSLFEHIHLQREKMTLHTRVQILQSVAQGMGYLHAKGIVLRKLNTSNIFLCPRVKVSAIDFSLPEARHNRKDYASIPRGHLTYVAPEMLKTLRVMPPRLVPTVAPSTESDVFAFGTIMYEVLGGAYPYPGFPPESVIWSVCSGQRQNLASISCTIPLKTLIEDCWSQEPLYRPDFPEISKELHKNSPQYKRHSSSEPERLNRSPGVLD